MAILPSSTCFLTAHGSALLVQLGHQEGITAVVGGLMPRSDLWISFSMAGIILASRRDDQQPGLGDEMLPNWFRGVGVP